MKQAHIRPGTLSLIGEIIFSAALLLGWVLADFADQSVAAIIVFFAGGIIGAAMGIFGDIKDMEKYRTRIQAGESSDILLPPRILYRMGTTAIGLGIIGFVFLAIGDAWANTIWLVIEIVSLVVGAVFIFLGHKVNEKRLKAVADLQSTIIDMPASTPSDHAVDAPIEHIDTPPSDSDNKA